MSQSVYQSVGIVVGSHDNHVVVNRLTKLLAQHGLNIVRDASNKLPDTPDSSASQWVDNDHDFAERSDIICCIGGDGTMLDAIARYYTHRKPFTGINLGKVGFLVDLLPDEVDKSFLNLLSDQSISERRMLLKLEVYRDREKIADYAAANEVFIRSHNGTRMIYLDVLVDQHPVHTERGDGLLICTPTGSTAYNLSNAGPILEPTLEVVCLTPISPYYLNSRPVVINAQSRIEIRVPTGQRSEIMIGCDGQRGLGLKETDVAKISKHPIDWTLLHPGDYEYFRLLRSKLKWGMEPPPGQAQIK